jgi:hypothetical protein
MVDMDFGSDFALPDTEASNKIASEATSGIDSNETA